MHVMEKSGHSLQIKKQYAAIGGKTKKSFGICSTSDKDMEWTATLYLKLELKKISIGLNSY